MKIGIITLLITGLMILTAGLASAQEAVSISGTVTDAATDDPIEGASVQVDGKDTVFTDSLGVYTITDAPTGEQSLTASADGYVSGTIDVLVSDTEGATADFSLQPVTPDPEPNTVIGTVTDATTGEPIEDASVQVDESDLASSTDASGQYTITGVPVGGQSVTASADGYDSETIGVDLSETAGALADFTLQPVIQEEEEDEGDDEGDDEGGKVAGDRKGYVGIFVSGTSGTTSSVTGSGPSTGFFFVSTKKGEIEIKIPEEGLESITKRPGRPAGVPEDGDRVAVLVEFMDDGAGGLVKVARQIIVKPAPKKPIVGAVVSITVDENGVRTLTIMRPNGTTKKVRLGSKGRPPEVGDLITAFQGNDGDGDDDGEDKPPIAKGLVRAQDVRQRLENILDDLAGRLDGLSDKQAEKLAKRLEKVAGKLEDHSSKHADIIEQVSKQKKLPPQAMAAMLNGLDRAQKGRSQAKIKATEARSKGRPFGNRGNSGNRGSDAPDGRNSRGSDNQNGRGSSSFGDQENKGNSGAKDKDDKGQGNNGRGKKDDNPSSGRGNSGNDGNRGNSGSSNRGNQGNRGNNR